MNNCYFDYAFYRCKRKGIKNVCNVFYLREELLSAVQETYRRGYLSDSLLLESVDKMLCKPQYFNEEYLDLDAKRILARCQTIIDRTQVCCRNGEDIDYDVLFDCLVNVGWLLSSRRFAADKGEKKWSLLSSPIESRRFLRQALSNEYSFAFNEINETVYISEAIRYVEMRYSPRHYQCEYEETEKYLDWDLDQLYDRRDCYERDSIERKSLFFGLTVTCMLAEEIRRRPI